MTSKFKKHSISIKHKFLFWLFSFFIISIGWSQNENCEATTIDEFYDCYGGKEAFSLHSQEVIDTYIQAEDAINEGNYTSAKNYLDQLFETYPIGDNVWKGMTRVNGANIGTPHGYYGLRMMHDIVTHHLGASENIVPIKLYMKVVLVGCSEGIQPSTLEEKENKTGVFVQNSLHPDLREDNYRIVKQSMNLFTRYMKAISQGNLEVVVEIIDLPDLCMEVSVYGNNNNFAVGPNTPVWNALSDEVKNATDWWWILYPSHVPDTPELKDLNFITGGMSSDEKGGAVFKGDDLSLVEKLGSAPDGAISDIERRMYLPQWFQHELYHYLYRLYQEHELEVNGHDWFIRSNWPADFVGQFETDYYAESLYKRIQLEDCEPLHQRAIKRIDENSSEQFNVLSADELIGDYSLDEISNNWQAGEIFKENDKFYWKNKANASWEIYPDMANGIINFDSSSPYPNGSFIIELYQDPITDAFVPGITGLTFKSAFYRKRFEMLEDDSIPFEIALGNYNGISTSGTILKQAGELYWQNGLGEKWLLTPNSEEAAFVLNSDSPTPGERFELIISTDECNASVVQGFTYLGAQYLKSDSPTVLGTNLAMLEGTATQSSNYSETEGLATSAIDGNSDGDWDNKSITHTQSEYRPWWQVRLENDHAIDQIKIWNRTDCCSERLRDFDVFVYNTAGDLVFKETIEEVTSNPMIIETNGAMGARVRIKLKNTDILSLAEVAVYGFPNTLSVANAVMNTVQFQMYPNPIREQFTIDLDASEDAVYTIIDINGKNVLTDKLKNGSNRIDSSALISGLYFLKVESEHGNAIQKIIKK